VHGSGQSMVCKVRLEWLVLEWRKKNTIALVRVIWAVIVGKPRHLVRKDNVFKLMLSYGRLVGLGISSVGSECK